MLVFNTLKYESGKWQEYVWNIENRKPRTEAYGILLKMGTFCEKICFP